MADQLEEAAILWNYMVYLYDVELTVPEMLVRCGLAESMRQAKQAAPVWARSNERWRRDVAAITETAPMEYFVLGVERGRRAALWARRP